MTIDSIHFTWIPLHSALLRILDTSATHGIPWDCNPTSSQEQALANCTCQILADTKCLKPSQIPNTSRMVRFVVSHSKLAPFFFFHILKRVWFQAAVSRLPYIRVITTASQVLPLCKVGGGGGIGGVPCIQCWVPVKLNSTHKNLHLTGKPPCSKHFFFSFFTPCITGGWGGGGGFFKNKKKSLIISNSPMVHHDMTRGDTYERMNSGSASKPKTKQWKILRKANETQAMGLTTRIFVFYYNEHICTLCMWLQIKWHHKHVHGCGVNTECAPRR